ncbi:MAG: TadE/TadG family type IV pilus assembly protein, partial [Pirellulaceae bacterium]
MEFAIVAPLFFLLVAGIIEFGQAFRIQHMLSNACRRGCRAAVVENATSSQVQQKVKAHCTKTLNVREGDITVHVAVNGNPSADLSQAKNGAEISVTVSIPFSGSSRNLVGTHRKRGDLLSCGNERTHQSLPCVAG